MSSLTLGRKHAPGDFVDLEGDGRQSILGIPLSLRGQAWVNALARFRFVYISVVLAVLISVISALKLFAPINGWFYDLLSSRAVLATSGEPGVILVEIEHGSLAGISPAEWIRLQDGLLGLGAKQIVYSSLPAQLDSDFYATAAASGRVVIGRRVLIDEATANQVLEPTSQAVMGLKVGASAVAPAQGGVHRAQSTLFTTKQGDLPALEVVAARSRGLEVPDGGFMINFLRGPQYIPSVSHDLVLAGKLIPAVVEGRSVLVGQGTPGVNQGIHSPLYQRLGTMSLAQFQAFSLDTLLRDAPISELPSLISFAMFLTILVFSVVAYSLADFSLSVRATLLAVVAYLLVTCLMLWRFEVSMPVSEMIGAQMLALLAVFGRRRLTQDLALRDLHTHMASRVRQRLAPAGFFREPELSKEAAGLIELTLNLEQFALLGRREPDRRLKLVATSNCQSEDLAGHAKVIAAALEAAKDQGTGPFQVAEPLIGGEIAGGTEHFIVPLLFAGEDYGAWLMVIQTEERKQISRFEDAVTVLAETLAELMMHRSRRADAGGESADALSRLYDADKRGEVASNLSQIFGLMERRLILLESVDHTMDSPVVVFDNFGTIIEANPEMEHWARLAGVKLFDMNALEFAATLTGQDIEISREHLRSILIDRRTVRFLVPRPGDAESLYDVFARPLAGLARDGAGPANFETEGIVFELHAVGHLIERFRRREEFIAHMIQQVASSAERMAEESDGDSVDAQGGFSGKEDLLDGASKLRDILSEDVLVGEMASFPVDPQFCLRNAVRDLRERLDQKSLEIDFQFPSSYSLVIANPEGLRDVFEGMLKVLIDDAAEGTRITATMEQSRTELGDWTGIRVRSMGFGIPTERLKAYLVTPSHRDDSPLAGLNRHAQVVDQWGGRVEGESTLGEGIFLTTRLKTFSPEPLNPPEISDADEA